MIELNIDSKNAKQLLAKQLAGKLAGAIVLCIGTEKVVADSIGPRVGSLLNENMPQPIFVYGMQGANIHAQNIAKAVEIIKQLHPNRPLLVVDAAVGEQSQIGRVQLSFGNISPGAATNKHLGKVGDVSIVGIVAHRDMADFYDNSVEQSILAERLSQFIATTIVMASKADVH
ncbi:MAG: spore protease YyaC [Clostridia bacterium]|nr:spore protease YyaC [Clostridia bacterium]